MNYFSCLNIALLFPFLLHIFAAYRVYREAQIVNRTRALQRQNTDPSHLTKTIAYADFSFIVFWRTCPNFVGKRVCCIARVPKYIPESPKIYVSRLSFDLSKMHSQFITTLRVSYAFYDAHSTSVYLSMQSTLCNIYLHLYTKASVCTVRTYKYTIHIKNQAIKLMLIV